MNTAHQISISSSLLAIAWLTLAMCSSVLWAQTAVPDDLTYQGRLIDTSGKGSPEGTRYEVEVRLWPTAAGGGMALWDVSDDNKAFVKIAENTTQNFDNATQSIASMVPSGHYYRVFYNESNAIRASYVAELR